MDYVWSDCWSSCLLDDAGKRADTALPWQTPQQVRGLLEDFQSAESIDSWRGNGHLWEPNTPAFMRATIALQQSADVAERRKSLHEMNEGLKHRIVESASRLSEANALLTKARLDDRLAAVVFETHNSIVITDKDGTVLRVNKSFNELTGYSPEEIVGQTLRILKSGRHGDEYYREMWHAIQTQGNWQGEIWNRRKDGHIYLQRLAIRCVKNESGAITHYVGDGHDLTEQKQGESDRVAILAARKVQRALLPSNGPCLPGFDIAGAVHPAERVSGDFFDYIPLGRNSIGVLVADVSGHGLGPALLMAQTQAYIRALAETCTDPGKLLARVARLFANSDSEHFVTMFLGRLDVVTREFVYIGAGHQAYLIAQDGTVRVLRSTSIPLGVENVLSTSSTSTISLKTGDILVVPTDGAEETMSVDGRQFGRDRIFDLVRNNRDKPAIEIVQTLFWTARDFAEQRPQEDDITALIVKVLAPPPPSRPLKKSVARRSGSTELAEVASRGPANSQQIWQTKTRR